MIVKTIAEQTIPSDLSRVSGLVDPVVEKLQALGLDEGTVFNMKLCFHEAVVNAINHGNKGNKALTVHVAVKADAQELVFEVTDQGKGFDHHALPDPTSEENIGKYHGRGIYLMKTMMDRVMFLNEGRTVKMVKLLKGGS